MVISKILSAMLATLSRLSSQIARIDLVLVVKRYRNMVRRKSSCLISLKRTEGLLSPSSNSESSFFAFRSSDCSNSWNNRFFLNRYMLFFAMVFYLCGHISSAISAISVSIEART